MIVWWTMSSPGWRRIGGVLRCRLDVCLVLEREAHHEPAHRPEAGRSFSAEEALDLFAQTDPVIADGGVSPAGLLGSFSE